VVSGNRVGSVTPRRFGVTVALTAIGVFTICGGVGKGDFGVDAIGLALLADAAGVYMVPALNARSSAYIHGTGRVVSATPPQAAGPFGRATLHLIVRARNMEAVPVKFRDPKVPLVKWPSVGVDLPVLISTGASRKVRVLWNEVPAHAAAPVPPTSVRVPPPPPADEPEADEPDADETYISADAYVDETTIPSYDDIDSTDMYGIDDSEPATPESTTPESTAPEPRTPEPAAPEPRKPEPVTPEPVTPEPRKPEPPRSAPRRTEPVPSIIVPTPRAGGAWSDLPAVDLSGVDDEPAVEAESDESDDAPAMLGVTETNGKRTIELDVSDPTVVRWTTEEIDDDPDDRPGPGPTPPPVGPTSPTSTGTASTGTTAPDAADPTRRRPSPRPRSGTNQPERGGVRKPAPPVPTDPPTGPEAAVRIDFGTEPPLETPYVLPDDTDPLLVSVALTDSMPTVPLRFHQARVVSPGVAATPDREDPLYDQAADAEAAAEAYLAATPPPGKPSAAGRIRSVAATLFVTDLSRSIMFYRDVLGFVEADAGRGSAVLISGDAKIVLRRVGMAPVDRRLVHILLEVPDVNAAYEDLRARSVPFIHRPRKVGQYEQQTLWAAALRDPDGHGIAITQWRDA
jgi:hypothetical protein